MENLDQNKIDNIYSQVAKLLENKTKEFEEAVIIDNNKYGCLVDVEKVKEIITKYSEKKSLIKMTNKEIITGIGNIACICDEIPYIIVNVICMSIKTKNNISLYLKEKILETNKMIINVFKEAIKKTGYDIKIEIKYRNNYNEFYENQDEYNSLIYIGRQEEYIKILKKLYIPSSFQSYGDIHVYFDSKEYRSVLLRMDKFAYLNDIHIHYYNNKNIKNDIELINKQGISSICVIFTKNLQKVKMFIEKVNSKEIYVNQNPFENYEFGLDENNFIMKKKLNN